MVWPVILVVASNCLYHMCSKSVPNDVNAFGTLMITYITSAIICSVLFLLMTKPDNVSFEMAKINWTSIALGVAIIGLETGYILMYRNGWKISSGSVVANICLAIALLVIGFILYKENISIKQIIGIIACAIGLILVTTS